MVTPTVAATATPSAVASPALPGTTKNQATVDITVNETGEWTIGGFSRKALGLGPIDSQAAQMAKDLNSAHLLLQAELVSVDVNGTPLLKLQWTPASRQVVADLAAKYGYAISPEVMVRIEEWITSSTLDVTARYSNDMSKPLVLHLTKPVVVDLGPEGQVTVEKLPLALTLDPGVFQTIKQGGIRNAVVCWNNGTLTTKVDGADLPLIMLDPKGVRMLSQALGLGIENSVDPFFSDLLGVDVSLPGGTHQTGVTCGN